VAAKPSIASFAPGPIEAIRDKSLTAQDWRILMAVSFHDRLSLPKGSGTGCVASNLLLAEETQMAYAAVCRTLTRLVEKGYLVREKRGRMTVYRVVYTTTKSLRDCPIPAAEIGDDPVTNQAADDGELDPAISDDGVIEPEKIGDDFADFSAASGSDETENQAQYITLRGVIDTPKEGKEIPYKGRTVPARGVVSVNVV
jgi:DNA-binding MarR family transcriptional regulator